ncbi:type VII secretion target [Mycobacterium kyorinense]|uniref:ESAT-6-like protein n=1 Tax=Mycobacterium kyorinense TaxID=487514 RepID=A0A1X1XYN6_9MYCO|nr:type VII secretion target [Mycobacterium kyorinense]ORW03962.1 hypothetical protein AWC14_04680 [Mycobacterium kyorinense]
MADDLQVDTAGLRSASDQLFSAVQSAAADFAEHETNLTQAAERWTGASKQALAEVAATWESRHAAHQQRLTTLAQSLADAATRYASTDADSAASIEAVEKLAREMSKGM